MTNQVRSASFRPLLVVLHRWAGLLSSLVLAFVGVTGAVFLLPGSNQFHTAVARWHAELGLGHVGWWIVAGFTAVAVLLELSGLYLWWRNRIWRVRWRAGWRVLAHDLHHAGGVVLLAMMLLLAGTGIGRPLVEPMPPSLVRKAIYALHTGGVFPWPIKVVYAVGSLGFLVQGVTGVVMWWRPSARRREPLQNGTINI